MFDCSAARAEREEFDVGATNRSGVERQKAPGVLNVIVFEPGPIRAIAGSARVADRTQTTRVNRHITRESVVRMSRISSDSTPGPLTSSDTLPAAAPPVILPVEERIDPAVETLSIADVAAPNTIPGVSVALVPEYVSRARFVVAFCPEIVIDDEELN